MFRTVLLSIIRSFSLYTQQWYVYMSNRFADSLRASCQQTCIWHIPLLCVQWKTPDDGQKNCPKHVEFYSKSKFEKLVHLVGFILKTFRGFTSGIWMIQRSLLWAVTQQHALTQILYKILLKTYKNDVWRSRCLVSLIFFYTTVVKFTSP